MALANKATNMTKYAAGGTGDNIIPDGYIKTVEKVWIDTVVLSSSLTLGTGAIFDIAHIPQGKKFMGCEVLYSTSLNVTILTTTTISIGARYGTTATTNATQFLASTTLGTATFNNQPIFALSNIGVECTGAAHTIFAQFSTVATALTGGTLTFKTKYT